MPKDRDGSAKDRERAKKDKKKAKKADNKVRPPKKKCCASKPRCSRCPLRMLAEGTLPEGYTVRKRRLVRTDGRPGGTKNGKEERDRPRVA